MDTTIDVSATRPAGSSAKRLRRLFYGGMPSPRNRFQNAVERLRLPHGSRILSVGCGYAAPDLHVLRVAAALRVGVDMVERFRRPPGSFVQLSRADAATLPFTDGAFHAVICRSVIEHLDAPRDAFAEIFRVLAPTGHFIFLTPSRYDYISLLASIIPDRWHGRLVRLATGRPESDTFPTRYRANSVRVLNTLARSIGYDVKSIEAVREHPNYLEFHPAAYLLGVTYEQIVERNCAAVRPWLLGHFQKPGQPDDRAAVAGE